MIDNILNDLIEYKLRQLTPDQKKMLKDRFTTNLRTNANVEYFEDGILITNEDVYKNWLYYAGFEYIDGDDITLLKDRGEFAAIFWVENERVQNVLDRLIEMNDEEAYDERDTLIRAGDLWEDR